MCILFFLFSHSFLQFFFIWFSSSLFCFQLSFWKRGTKSGRYSICLRKESSYLFILWTELENRHLTMQYLLIVDVIPHIEKITVFDLSTLLLLLHMQMVQPRVSWLWWVVCLFILRRELQNVHLTIQYLLMVNTISWMKIFPVFNLSTLLLLLYIKIVQSKLSWS